MSLTSQSSRVEYTAAAAQTTFAYPYKIFATTDLAVFVNGSELNTAQYSVTGAGTDDGGNVILVTPAAEGARVLIESSIPYTQQVTYNAGGPFPAASHERGLDRLARLTQQLKAITDRCLQINQALSHGLTALELPVPTGDPTQADGRWAPVWNAARTNLELTELTTEVGLLASQVQSATHAALPAAGETGRLRQLTDSIRGIWVDAGIQWRAIDARANVRDFGARGNSSDDDTAAFIAADAAAAANGVAVYIPKGLYRIDSLTTTAPWNFANGAIVVVTAAEEVSFAFEVDAPATRIFDADGSSSGTVVFSVAQETPAEWWGASIHAVDNRIFLQAALNAATRVSLGSGTYLFTSGFALREGNVLQGAGQDAPVTSNEASGTVLSGQFAGALLTLPRWAFLRDMTLTGVNNTSGSIGIAGESGASPFAASASVIENVFVSFFDENIVVDGAIFTEFNAVHSRNATVAFCHTGANRTANVLHWNGGSITDSTTGVLIGEGTPAANNAGIEFSNLSFERNTTGVDIHGGTNYLFRGVHWEGNDTDGIFSDSATGGSPIILGVMFVANSFQAQTNGFIFNDNTQDVAIYGGVKNGSSLKILTNNSPFPVHVYGLTGVQRTEFVGNVVHHEYLDGSTSFSPFEQVQFSPDVSSEFPFYAVERPGGGGENLIYLAGVDTSNAASTAVLTFRPPANNTTLVFNVKVFARRSGIQSGRWWHFQAMFTRSSTGVVVQQSTTQTVDTIDSAAGNSSTLTASFSVTSPEIFLNVAGNAAENWRWSVYAEVHSVVFS